MLRVQRRECEIVRVGRQLRSFEKARKATNGKEKGNTTREVVELLPVPPCIRRGKGGKKLIISVRVIDRQEKCSVMDISAEKVSICDEKSGRERVVGARSVGIFERDVEMPSGSVIRVSERRRRRRRRGDERNRVRRRRIDVAGNGVSSARKESRGGCFVMRKCDRFIESFL